MGFATFSGPVRSGTERYGAAENTGLITLSRTAYVNVSGVALTAARWLRRCSRYLLAPRS